MLRHPAIKGYLAELARDLQWDFEHDLASGDSRIRARVEQGVVQVAHLLIDDHALRAKLNGWLCSALVDLVEKHGPDVSQFIQERVGRWDAAQLTRKLEESVGRDLQYIRLNGTLVGGLIGLLIFALSQWIW